MTDAIVWQLGKEGNSLIKNNSNNINEPANSEDTARYDPKKADYYVTAKNAVNSLNYRIKKDSKNNIWDPAKFVNVC